MENSPYSPQELAMFTALGMDDERLGSLSVENLYASAVNYTYLEGMSGPAVESLTRCVRALQHGVCKRLTAEFNDLIQLDGDQTNANKTNKARNFQSASRS